MKKKQVVISFKTKPIILDIKPEEIVRNLFYEKQNSRQRKRKEN